MRKCTHFFAIHRIALNIHVFAENECKSSPSQPWPSGFLSSSIMAGTTTSGDLQLAAAAAGFSLGFGFLTVVRAYKQTRANRAPARSAYIYMLWGEILANLVLGIMTWLYLKDVVKTT